MQCALSEAQTEHVQAMLQPNHFATFIDGWPAPWQDPRSTAHSAAAWQHGSTVAETLRRHMHCARQLCQESITMPMLVHVQVEAHAICALSGSGHSMVLVHFDAVHSGTRDIILEVFASLQCRWATRST